jgi:hypothetical protein
MLHVTIKQPGYFYQDFKLSGYVWNGGIQSSAPAEGNDHSK